MMHQKKVVEHVSGWLRVFDDGSVDRTWTGPPEVKFMAEPVLAHENFVNGVATRDVTFGTNAKNQVRIYLPKLSMNDKEKLPILLHFHGGGFCISRADYFMYYDTYTKLAKFAQAICVSVYLRLAPEHKLPAAIDDGFSALQWLNSVAKAELHEPWLENYGDFSRVFLIGDSSGGNVVHEVAAKAGKADLDQVMLAGAIPIHPGFIRSTRSRSELEQPQTPFLTLDMLDKFLGLALPTGSNKDHPITCPMGDAAPKLEEIKFPPVLLCLAEKDLVIDTEMEYYDAMIKANKDVEILMSHGMTHSFYLNKIAVEMNPSNSAATDHLYAGIADFIKRH